MSLHDEFESLAVKDLVTMNASLGAKKLEPIQPITREAWDRANSESEAESSGGRQLRAIDIFGWR